MMKNIVDIISHKSFIQKMTRNMKLHKILCLILLVHLKNTSTSEKTCFPILVPDYTLLWASIRFSTLKGFWSSLILIKIPSSNNLDSLFKISC